MTSSLYDTECYPNYWLLKLRPVGGNVRSWRLFAGQSFTLEQREDIANTMDTYTVISFNGIYYDVPMIAAALYGYTCEQLKWLNDQIIVEKRKPWELGLPEWKPADHIDIMEVLPGQGGQKMYAGRLHCKSMRDLPYDPAQYLTEAEMLEVDSYCENDLDVLEDLYVNAGPLIDLRAQLSERYGIDLRSKSDAQLAEVVLKKRCEQAMGYRIFRPEIDWNLKFRYTPPSWLAFQNPQLQQALALVSSAIFSLGASGAVTMPPQLDGLEIPIGAGVYRLGIGGLHSSEKTVAYKTNESHVLRDADVASYYPNLILNSGKFPPALGSTFLTEYAAIKDERLVAKAREKTLTKGTPEWTEAHIANEGGKIMINGTFGKTGSPYSILFAPEMLIQTTVTGQLALLMLIEWHEHYGIPIVSANTDGIVMNCPRSHVATSEALIAEWQRRTGLEMEVSEYAALYSRDVNNYVAVKADTLGCGGSMRLCDGICPDGDCYFGGVKRKGTYAPAGLVEKKNPDVEICGDAVAEFLAHGTPILYTIASCRDIRKFVTMQKVAGGAVKLWGEGPRKGVLVRDMTTTLTACGWVKVGRKWHIPDERPGVNYPPVDAITAYRACFQPQTPEYLGKVIRWYYSTQAPGPIIYNTNGNQVSLSYGARPCMTLPSELPDDIDYGWYAATCDEMLRDLGYAG
jgi:hypothetical protein